MGLQGRHLAQFLQICRSSRPLLRRIRVDTVTRFLMVTILLSVVIGCAKEKAPTPPSVAAQFYALLDSLVNDPPGAAVDSLEAFLHQYGTYQIADMVRTELNRFREKARGRYHEARELARRGEFDDAERILEDLAQHLADTPDGENAKRYLEFEFYFSKAKWLMVRQRYEECEVVARALLERDLTAFQADQVEMILDNVGYVDTALSLSERANARNACRQLSIMLAQQYVEEGIFPSSLSFSDVKSWGPHNSEYILRGLSAIEDYKASKHSFSFVGVSENGRHRIRVVDGQIQD
jgi:tetratricopeptide (TPR) repeat protein